MLLAMLQAISDLENSWLCLEAVFMFLVFSEMLMLQTILTLEYCWWCLEAVLQSGSDIRGHSPPLRVPVKANSLVCHICVKQQQQQQHIIRRYV